MTQVTGSDLIEAVVDGLRAQGEDEVEILRFLGGLRDLLARPSWCQAAAQAVQAYLNETAPARGICPRCGEELEALTYYNHLPGGTEVRREVYCPSCDRGAVATLRPVAVKREALAE